MSSFTRAWGRAEAIYGWLWEDEARLLFDHVRSPWCEIGAFLGRSTMILATAGPGYVIDSFQGSPAHSAEVAYYDENDVRQQYEENTKGLPLTVLPMDFEAAAELIPEVELEFLYLDAEHSFDATKAAFDLYAPMLGGGGLVAFHDVGDPGWPEVREFVRTVPWPVKAEAGRVVILEKPA